MNKVKRYSIGVFNKNGIRKGVYDLESPDVFPFSYLNISQAKESYLLKQGAEMVLNHWDKHHNKTLHTGLISIGNNCFFGDNLNGGWKDFIVLQYLPQNKKLLFLLLRKCNPKNKVAFAQKAIQDLIIPKEVLTNEE